jgi:UDP-N-acetylglucosamine--N-acetylmuramyl-(pentapeptide) pyrophosphoryl-undecaprenol N-acetylglucosamine transferase
MTAAPNAPLALIAAGGTGGHVFPARALAETLLARGWRVGLVTDKRGTAFETEAGELEVFRIHAAGIAGRGLLAKIKAAAALARGFVQCRTIVHREKPAVVVAFGGYVSVPPVIAAHARQIPIVLHEQNAVLGRANRLLASRATAIATSFAEVGKIPAEARDAVVMTGNPVRVGIRSVRDRDYPTRDADGRFELLVTGGSQGASVFAELIPEAIANLPEALRKRIRISQQTREAEVDRVVGIYRHLGVEATVGKFFGDMPERLAAAHLLVCRSGASTVAENTVAGRPALLVPYPHATDDHQTANARAIEAQGAAWSLPQSDLSAERLAERLEDLMSHPELLTAAAAAAHRAGVPDAVERLADLISNTARLRAGQALPDIAQSSDPSSEDTSSLTQRAVA